jgi:hypothetical protein
MIIVRIRGLVFLSFMLLSTALSWAQTEPDTAMAWPRADRLLQYHTIESTIISYQSEMGKSRRSDHISAQTDKEFVQATLYLNDRHVVGKINLHIAGPSEAALPIILQGHDVDHADQYITLRTDTVVASGDAEIDLDGFYTDRIRILVDTTAVAGAAIQSLTAQELVLNASPRIMLIGDSITEGLVSGNGIAFRKVLYDLLTAAGLGPDFVGSYGDPPYEGHFQGSRKVFDFYPSSLGHGGTGVMDVTADMNNYRPTMAAIHLGTNGFTTNTEQMATLVKYLLTWRTGKGSFLQHVIVSQIIPMETNDSAVVVFNTKLSRLVQDFQKGRVTGQPEPVYLCDHFSRFVENPMLWADDARTLMADNLHPTLNGYQIMGKTYYDVMAPLLTGTPYWFTDAVWDMGLAGVDHHYGGQGLALADLNNDNKDDFYTSRIAAGSAQNRHLFYLSQDTLPYPESAASFQAGDAGDGRGVLFFDMDSDGDYDLFNTHSSGQNKLLENVKNQYFRNVTTTNGISSSTDEAVSVLAFDAERDNDLDLFVLNKRTVNEFYLNNGKGVFIKKDRGCNDVAESNSEATRLSASAADFDNDGDVDIYVVKRYAPNRLYVNNGAGSFTDRAEALGLNLNKKCNAAWWSDLDNDGDLDLAVSLADKTTDGSLLLRIFQNNGDGTFADVTATAAVSMNGYSIIIADFDNDGLQDIITANEAIYGAYYKNNGAMRFSKVANTGAEIYAGDTRSAAAVDVDHDGDMDFFLNRADALNVLKRNTMTTTNHFLKIKANGPNGNQGGFGAKIWCYPAGELANPAALLGYREIVSASGHLTQASPTQHFGLAGHSRVDVLAQFTDGTLLAVRNQPADQTMVIKPELVQNNGTVASQLLIQAGQDQKAIVGRPLPVPITVKVVDAAGRPVANVAVDYTLLTGDAQLVEPSTTGNAIWLEPESGGLSGATRWAYDNQCSGSGLIVQSPLLKTFGSDTVKFQVTQAGNYYLWLRLFHPGSSATSLGLQMDGLNKATTLVNETADWQWMRAATSSSVYALANGKHTLLLTWSGGTLQIDRALLTIDPYYTPVGLGEQSNIDPLATDQNGLTWRRVQLAQKTGAVAVQARIKNNTTIPAVTFSAQALPGTPTTLQEISGNHQPSGKKGEKLPLPFVAAVRDAFGNPVPGRSVKFKVVSGGGALTPADGLTVTDANGQAAASLTLGSGAGLQRVSVETDSVTNSPIYFTATVTGVATEMRLLDWSAPTDTVNKVLSKPVQVAVLDDSGQPAIAYPLRFHALRGGHVSATTVAGGDTAIILYTNAQGKAQAYWQLAKASGAQTLQVEAAGLTGSPLAAQAFALPGRPISLLAVSGDQQQAQVLTPLPLPFRIRVWDSFGNPVARQSVSFKVKSGDGTFAGLNQVSVLSDSNGVAGVYFTVGKKAGVGIYMVEVSASFTISTVAFLAGATPGPASLLVNLSSLSLSGVLGALLSEPMQVRVLDNYQNGVSGVTVQFSVAKGDGVFSNGLRQVIVVTDAEGVAGVHYRVGSSAGVNNQQVQATAVGVTPAQILYTISALAGQPAVLAGVSGNGQSTVAYSRLAAPFVVKVTDAANNPVAGHPVRFEVISAAGSLQGERSREALSDTSGLVQAFLVVTDQIGDSAYVVQASSSYDGAALRNSPVRFYASVLPAKPARLFPITNPNQWLDGFAYKELAQPIVVQVIDESGRGVAGIGVTYKVTSGSGVFLPDRATTVTMFSDSEGMTRLRYVLGAPGTGNTISASAEYNSAPLGNSPIVYQALARTAVVNIEVLSSVAPSAIVNAIVAEAVKVKIVDSDGQAAAGHAVRFVVKKGLGSIVANADTVYNTITNTDGTASIQWRLGTEAGRTTQQLQVLAINAEGIPISGSSILIQAHALPDAADATRSQLTALSPAFTGNDKGSALLLTAQDRFGNKVPQQPVEIAGSGLAVSVNPAQGFTDSLGVFTAQALATAGGEWTARALDAKTKIALGQAVKVQFIDLSAAAIAAVGSTSKKALVADTLAEPLQVLVKDGLNRALPNSLVEFSITQGEAFFLAGDGYIVDYRIADNIQVADVLTDQRGIAQVRLLLGSRSGLVQVSSSPKNAADMQVTFNIQVQPGSPAALQKINGDQQTGVSGHRLNQPLQVRLQDSYGNVIPDHWLQFTCSETGAGFLPAQRVLTDSLGVGRTLWQLGENTGLQQATVLADGLAQSVFFFANATANSVPIFSLNDAYALQEGQLFTLTIAVQDAELDSITLAATGLPQGSVLKNGLFTWKPDYTQSGDYVVQFMAADQLGAGTKKTVILQVAAANRPPVIQNDQTLPQQRELGNLRKPGNYIDLKISAQDPDGDQIFYSWMVNGLFKASNPSYRLQSDQFGLGNYVVKAVASDGQDTTSVSWRVQIVTVVVLSRFEGCYQPHQGVSLFWQTAREADNLGFYVLQSLKPDGPFARIGSFIPARSDGRYSYQDPMPVIGGLCYYRLQDVSINGWITEHETISIQAPLPTEFSLEQNYPNPFNGATAIAMQMPKSEQAKLQIYDVTGRLVTTLVNMVLRPGYYRYSWNARNDQDKEVAAGVYYCVFSCPSVKLSRKIILLR